MARKTIYLDDVTGKEIADGEGGPVRFSLRDEFYEIDISNETLAKLEKLLKPYIDVAATVEPPRAEPAGRRGRAPTATRMQVPGRGRDYLDAVRRWARDNGHVVADRGRIKAEIVDAYEAAHK